MRRLRSLPFFLLAVTALVYVTGAGATTLSSIVLPNGTTDTAYNQVLTGMGGAGSPYTFAVTAGALPPGLTLDSAGTLSGTPTSSGSYSFTVFSFDSFGFGTAQDYTLSISPATLSIIPTTFFPGERTVFYEDFLDTVGGTAPYTYAVTSGVLPAGITLDSGGYLSGVPAAAGSFTFTVRVTDAHSSIASRTYTLNINLQTLNIDPPTLNAGTAGAAYADQLVGVGGTPPYTFSVANGSSLPPGLVLAANGAVTGTPSLGGVFAFGVTVRDATGATMSRAYVFNVDLLPLLVSASLGSGAYGVPYDASFSASGGTPAYKYALASGTLPPGLTLSSVGELYGTPTTPGSYVFDISASDKYGDYGEFPFTLVIDVAHILMTPDDLFAATSGLFYSAKMAATGGIGTYTYTISAGALPVGLTLGTDGTISGIPDQAPGLFSFTVKATDSNLAAGTKKMTLKLETPLILVNSFALPAATVGVGYHQTLSVNGGSAPYTYSLVDGILPAGLVLSTDGILTGSAKAPGTSTFTVLIVDANGVQAQQSFRVVVVKSPPTVVKKRAPKKVVATPPHKKKVKAKAKPKKHH